MLSNLHDHHEVLVNWHLQKGLSKSKAEDAARVDFEKYLKRRFAGAADSNSISNINRGLYLHMATISLAVSVVFGCVASLGFILDTLPEKDSPRQVEVIDDLPAKVGETKVGDKDKSEEDTLGNEQSTESKPSAADSQDEQTVESLDVPPEGPPNIIIKLETVLPPEKDSDDNK